tara:strand:- start:609 stop:935 length:327 start_codon:yes stop_codon:yes gene_type:complete
MIKFKKTILLLIIFLTFQSCSTLKEGFSSQKKNSTDEFLVEKKSPLVLPPDYDKLPIPKSADEIDEKDFVSKNEIEKLISNSENINNSDTNNQSGNIENSIIEKIKRN